MAANPRVMQNAKETLLKTLQKRGEKKSDLNNRCLFKQNFSKLHLIENNNAIFEINLCSFITLVNVEIKKLKSNVLELKGNCLLCMHT